MLFGLRCFTLDTIVGFCFAQDVNAVAAPDFRAPIVVAMDSSLPGFVVFRHFEAVRRMVFAMPGWMTKLSTPALAGLVDLQEMLGAQVGEVARNPESLMKSPHPIIYHRLMDPEANGAGGIPSPGSLYEEAQALLFGGADSAANTAMVGLFHLLQDRKKEDRLRAEVTAIWPDPAEPPTFEQLEKLPYLTAVIKESLRMAPGVPSPLPRVVPRTGANIGGKQIPPGTIVGMSSLFVHLSGDIFPRQDSFEPERWLEDGSARLDRWLVAFSKGPRACLGQNLGMCELYIALATLFRRFNFRLDLSHKSDLAWKDCSLPAFSPNHLRVFCEPIEE